MLTGKIKWFDPKKGYGFIECTSGEKDVFIHISELEASGISDIKENTKVSFDVSKQKGKTSATSIKIIK